MWYGICSQREYPFSDNRIYFFLQPNGKLLAIMGPSGSGKSSLLNVLAGRSSSSKSRDIEVKGKIEVGGFPIDPVQFRKNIAYVMQEDALMATATPREALRFSALLRLPPETKEDTIHKVWYFC